MKVEFNEFGGFIFEAEDGRDKVWLKEFAENVGSETTSPILSDYFKIDMEDGNVGEDGEPIKEAGFEDVLDEKGNAWGTIEKLEFSPFGQLAGPWDFEVLHKVHEKRKQEIKDWMLKYQKSGEKYMQERYKETAEIYNKMFPSNELEVN